MSEAEEVVASGEAFNVIWHEETGQDGKRHLVIDGIAKSDDTYEVIWHEEAGANGKRRLVIDGVRKKG
jgi:type IV secretory pathway TrbF-like protein